MSIKLVMLKSGEDLVADVKEIKSNDEVIGYYFDNPLIIKIQRSEEPKVLNEENKDGVFKQYASKIDLIFYPWIPLSKEVRIPCSADWVVTMVEPVDKLKAQYQEKLSGKNNQNPTVIK